MQNPIGRQIFEEVYPDTIFGDSPDCSLIAAGGRVAYKSIQLTNDGATHQNLFTITGAIRLLQIYGVATTVANSTKFDAVDFDVFDTATATVMTGATDCSGIAVKDIVAKTADDATGLTFIDGSVAAYIENADV